MSVFISYSRRQFYCAEDLALALAQHGVDAWFDVHRLAPAADWEHEIDAALRACDGVVLVASRDALASPHVRGELELARQLGKPIVVALVDRVRVPEDLPVEHVVDLRRRYDTGVRQLSEIVAHGFDLVPSRRVRWSSRRRPPVVRMVSAMLVAGGLLCVPSGLLSLEGPSEVRQLAAGSYAVGAVGAAWLWWAFGRRRRGVMNMLAFAFAVCVVGVASAAASSVYGMATANRDAPVYVLVCLPLLGALVWAAWAARSASFYRWLATGDAPRWMRRRAHVRRGRVARPAEPAPASITYDISSHGADESVQRALDDVLLAHGHVRGDATAQRQIVVVGDLTPRDWLAERLATMQRPVIVVSTPISPDALEHVERYQWVDHRRRDRATLEHLATSIADASAKPSADVVPESLQRRVLPFAVLVLGGWYVAVAATTLSLGIAGLAGAQLPAMSGATTSDPTLAAIASMLTGGATLVAGASLAARRLAMRTFLAIVTVAYLSTVATVLLLYPGAAVWVKLPAFVMAPLALLVGRRTLVGWLPARPGRRSRQTLAVDGGTLRRRRAPSVFVLATTAMTLAWVGMSPAAPPETSPYAGEVSRAQLEIADDQMAIRTTLAGFEHGWRTRNYAAMCGELDSSYVRRAQAETGSCEAAIEIAFADTVAPTFEVLSVDVSGDRATARVRRSDTLDDTILALVREAAGWRMQFADG